MKQERVLLASIHYDVPEQYEDQPEGINNGWLVNGISHDDVRSTMEQTIHNYDKFFARKSNEGFLTSKNRFVGHVEAFQIAFRCGQVSNVESSHRGNGELSSEDLY